MTKDIKKEKDYLSTREAVKLFDVAVSTIKNWTDKGLLKAWAIVDEHRQIEKSSVEIMLNEYKNSPPKVNHKPAISIVAAEDNLQEGMLHEQQFNLWNINTNYYSFKDGYTGCSR